MRDFSVHALGRRVGMYVATMTAKSNQTELLGYGAEIMMGGIIKVSVLFLIAALGGVVFEVSVLFLVTGIIRTFSGGAHCSAYYRCLITSVIAITALAYMLKASFPFILGLPNVELVGVLILSFYLYWRYAPQAPLNKPLKSKAMEVKFRKLSLITVIFLSIATIIVGPANSISWIIASGMLWQAFTLVPLGHRFIKALDTILVLSLKGGEAKCGN